MRKKPNIVFILADDLGFGDIGAFGNDVIRTPQLDRLCGEGLMLEQHYSASPMCAPARASLLTGKYNHRTGAVDVPSNRGLDRIDTECTTIADLLSAAGYATGMIGKWHNGLHDMRFHPNSRGFDEFAGFLNGGMDYWRWVLDYNGVPRPSDGRYLTDVFTDEAREFLKRHRTEPFFLYLAYNAPHLPLQVPEEDLAVYEDRADLNPAVRTLYAMISRMDRGIGHILDALKELALDENTIVVFSSDNGPYMGGVDEESCRRYNGILNGCKGDVLDGGIRVPAIVRWPAAIAQGTQTGSFMHFTDWLPTLLGMAGVSLSGELRLDGCDVQKMLLGGRTNSPDVPARFWQWNRYDPVSHCNAAVREGPWKLYWPPVPDAMRKEPGDQTWYQEGMTGPHRLMVIETQPVARNLSRPQAPRLFNLNVDPGESIDLAGEYPEIAARLTKKWNRWFEEVDGERKRAQLQTGFKG